MTESGPDQTCRALIEELNLGRADEVGAITPLAGGVASDIARVEVGDRVYCVKAALAKLKVAEDWFAPVHRNQAEYLWLEVASKIAPESVPKLYGKSASGNGFVMEFITGADIYLWKRALLAGQSPKHEASSVGDLLGRIHRHTAQKDFDRSGFQNQDDFRALRLEPYLIFTASKYPGISAKLKRIADQLYGSDIALIHGDVSPKNILFRGNIPILLDAECATMGDPCFDIAFCLNHLILKSFHLPALRGTLLENVLDFWRTYAPFVTWESSADLERRICDLLPALMLARIDGKSPVEYLNEPSRNAVREIAISLIERAEPDLASITVSIQNAQDQI